MHALHRTPPMTIPRLAIVGAGFTGTLLAVHVLREAKTPLTIHLIEQHGWFGRGVAYSTTNPSHLLNVRVANMSAFPEELSHFLLWLWRHDYQADGQPIPPSGHAFVPRNMYGDYLEDTLDEACQDAASGVDCEMRASAAITLTRDGDRYLLTFQNGVAEEFDRVALCVGNLPPALPCPAIGDLDYPQYIADPWHEPALTDIAPDAPVAIIGTGLTAADVVLSLIDQGHRGPITALSRRGLLPHRHAEARRYRDFLAGEPAPESLLKLLRRLRAEIDQAAEAGYNWRSVIDAVRPHTQRCWQALSEAERRRFLRPVRPYWEIHRHRMAPRVAQRLWKASARGQLTLRKGRLRTIALDGREVVLSYQPRGEQSPRQLRAAHVINGSGPECDLDRLKHPLLRSLIDQGLARPNPLRLGIEVTSDFRLVGRDGRPVPGLRALGPIARGAHWELTAVPELRTECARMGRRLALELAQTAQSSARERFG